MANRRLLAVATLGLLSAIAANAQSECLSLLAQGVFNRTAFEETTEGKETLRKWWCTLDEGSVNRQLDTGASFPLPDGLPQFSGHLDGSELNTWKKTHCSEDERRTLSSTARSVLEQRASPELAGAFNECMRITSQGIHAWAEGVDANSAFIYIKYSATGKNPPRPRVESSTLSPNARSQKPGAQPGTLLPIGTQLAFGVTPVPITRTGTEAVTFSIDTDAGNASGSLRALERECAENEYCQGEVIACQCSSDLPSECSSGKWLVGVEVHFGTWRNDECKVSGAGWYARIGSCQTGKGTGYQRCARVRVR